MVSMSAEQCERLDKLEQRARKAGELAGDYYGRGQWPAPLVTLDLLNSLISEVRYLASALKEQVVEVAE